MRNIALIMRRDLSAYLRSPLGYVIASIILCLNGITFNAWAVGGAPKLSAEVIRDFFFFSAGWMATASVFLTMRLLAEERQLKTIVLLHTSPVREIELVLGKFLSAFVFLSALTVCTVYMPALVMLNGKVSIGHLLVGYLGVLLFGAAATSIGVFASAVSPNQVVAAVASAGILLALVLMWWLARIADPPVKQLVGALQMHGRNFQPFMEGILELKHVFYYLGLTYFFLLLSTRVVEARRWR